MKTEEKILELYNLSSGPNISATLTSILKLLWSTLNNSVSLVDLVGIYAVSIPSNQNLDTLTADYFSDFIRSFARLKFSVGSDFCERLLHEIGTYRRPVTDTSLLTNIADRNIIRILLKYDIPLRKSFALFSSKGVSNGGLVTWDEVKQLSLGMELNGFLSFCGAYTILPDIFSSQQCEIMFREILSKFPLNANASSLGTTILYPQFQLLVALMASERHSLNLKKNEKGFAKKVIDPKARPLVDILQDFLKHIGINKSEEKLSHQKGINDQPADAERVNLMENVLEATDQESKSDLTGIVSQPSTSRAENMYQSAGDHKKQSLLLRIEHLFDEIEAKLVTQLPSDAPILSLLSKSSDELPDSKVKLPSKPVVIFDAVPIPSCCPETVEQLLEAALAHHNLSSFEEALKFLEAGRIQLADIMTHAQPSPTSKVGTPTKHKVLANASESDSELYFDVQMYITLCKGNVYQSCGDDEQSLLQYIEGWSRARQRHEKDWEVICLNCAGMLAFYNLRYDVALLCFNAVYQFREGAYGVDGADTAIALNNEACALHCLRRRGDARMRFEKSWYVLSSVLGHRAPRSVTVWKNLEKARRSHVSQQSKQNLSESVLMRTDASKLLIGRSFTIQALPPPDAVRKKKTGGKKKKK